MPDRPDSVVQARSVRVSNLKSLISSGTANASRSAGAQSRPSVIPSPSASDATAFRASASPAFPVIANSVTWNEQGLIVVSATSDENTYLVPSPGVRLNLADLVKNANAPSSLQVIAVNNHADIVGAAESSAFLFIRD